VSKQVWQGLLVRIDEGEVLTKLAQRSGQTTMMTLRQALSGDQLRGQYASQEKKVTPPAYGHRVAVVMAI